MDSARESFSGDAVTTSVSPPAPAPEPATELPIESWRGFIEPLDPTHESRKGPDLLKQLSDSELSLEDAAEETKRKRWGDLVGGPQDAGRTNESIVEHKVQGNRAFKDVREATDDMAFSRMRAVREELRGQGYNDDQLDALAYSVATRQTAVVDPKTGLAVEGPDPAPAPVGLSNEWGHELSKRGERVTPEEALNPRRAAELLGNWREAQARAQAEELAALQGQAEAPQETAQQYAEPDVQPEQQHQPERTAQAFSQEQAALAQERQYVAQIGNMSLEEAGALSDLTRLGEWANQNIPEIPALRQLAQTNPQQYQAELQRMQVQQPQKFTALQQVDQLARQHQARLAHATQQRQLIQSQYEARQNHATMQTLKAYRDQQDNEFDQRAAAITPQWNDPNLRREIRDRVSKTFKEHGLTQQQLNELWSGNATVDLHHPAAQVALLKAALWDRAQESMRNLKRAPIPPVQRPGTSRPRGADSVDQLRDLDSQLGRARGTQEQLRIAAKISRTRRGMETY